MTLDLDTFLTALYTTVDDLYQQHFAQHKPHRRGRRPELTDSEVLTLTICSQWFGTSERRFIRYATEHWRSYFPKLLSQSAYNRRSRDLAGVLVRLVRVVAHELRAYAAPYQAMDIVPVPLMRRCRGRRKRLFPTEAGMGRGGSDRDWYYGCKLLVSCTPEGAFTGFALAPASTEERWVADAFLCWRADELAYPLDVDDLPSPYRSNGRRYVGPTGPLWPRSGAGAPSGVPYIADNGFFGSWWQRHWREDYGAVVFTTKNYSGADASSSKRQHSSRKQIVETVNAHLEMDFGLHFPGARSKWGLLTRIAAKIAAMNLGIWLNRRFHRPSLALGTLFNC